MHDKFEENKNSSPVSFYVTPANSMKLKGHSDLLSKFLIGKFSTETKSLLEKYDDSHLPSNELIDALEKDFKEIINGDSIYEEKRFSDVELTPEIRKKVGSGLQGTELSKLNSELLENAYPQFAEIKKPDTMSDLFDLQMSDLTLKYAKSLECLPKSSPSH